MRWAFYTGTSNPVPCRITRARQSLQQILPREFLGMDLIEAQVKVWILFLTKMHIISTLKIMHSGISLGSRHS